MSQKIVVNTEHGGFSISVEAARFMAARGNARAKAELNAHNVSQFYGYGYVEGEEFEGGYDRADPDLIAAVEALGARASGPLACLEVAEIPDDVEWEIEEYDGLEWVAEKHRTWFGGSHERG